MKRIMAIALILICSLAITACYDTAPRDGILLKDGTVQKVSVSFLPEKYNRSFSGDAAQSIVDYISELNLISDFPENPDEYGGGTWVIVLEYDDGSNLTIYQFGNMFIRSENSSWYKMIREEAQRLEPLLDELSR